MLYLFALIIGIHIRYDIYMRQGLYFTYLSYQTR